MQLWLANICLKNPNRNEEPKARETPERIRRAADRQIARLAHSTKKKSPQHATTTRRKNVAARAGLSLPETRNRPYRPMKVAERAPTKVPAAVRARGAARILEAPQARWSTRSPKRLILMTLPEEPPPPRLGSNRIAGPRIRVTKWWPSEQSEQSRGPGQSPLGIADMSPACTGWRSPPTRVVRSISPRIRQTHELAQVLVAVSPDTRFEAPSDTAARSGSPGQTTSGWCRSSRCGISRPYGADAERSSRSRPRFRFRRRAMRRAAGDHEVLAATALCGAEARPIARCGPGSRGRSCPRTQPHHTAGPTRCRPRSPLR